MSSKDTVMDRDGNHAIIHGMLAPSGKAISLPLSKLQSKGHSDGLNTVLPFKGIGHPIRAKMADLQAFKYRRLRVKPNLRKQALTRIGRGHTHKYNHVETKFCTVPTKGSSSAIYVFNMTRRTLFNCVETELAHEFVKPH